MGEIVVLLVAPVRMRESAEYGAAVRLAEDRHPEQRIIADSQMWNTAKGFQETYKHWLSSITVSHLYILTAPDGTIGRGIFNIWRYLTKHQSSKTTALSPLGTRDAFDE